MKYAVILAGGSGKRMKSEISKQFISVSGIPIIVRTIQKIIGIDIFDRVIIAIHSDWNDELLYLINKYKFDKSKIIIVNGGVERIDSIYNAVNHINSSYGIFESDIILIHDAVRPFITKKIIYDSIEALQLHDAVVASLPVVDTILWVENAPFVSSMPIRSKLFHGQAPDSFRLQVLYNALFNLTSNEKKIITGTAQICMLKGIEIFTICGDPINIKITTPFDIKLAEYFCSLEVNNESLCS